MKSVNAQALFIQYTYSYAPFQKRKLNSLMLESMFHDEIFRPILPSSLHEEKKLLASFLKSRAIAVDHSIRTNFGFVQSTWILHVPRAPLVTQSFAVDSLFTSCVLVRQNLGEPSNVVYSFVLGINKS
jgi:hypothetical protein